MKLRKWEGFQAGVQSRKFFHKLERIPVRLKLRVTKKGKLDVGAEVQMHPLYVEKSVTGQDCYEPNQGADLCG